MEPTGPSLHNLLRVRSTVSVVRGEVSLVGSATSNRPFRSSLTDRGAGVIAILPFSQRTSSGIPGFIPDSRRIFFGISSLPEWSMVVFMLRRIPSLLTARHDILGIDYTACDKQDLLKSYGSDWSCFPSADFLDSVRISDCSLPKRYFRQSMNFPASVRAE